MNDEIREILDYMKEESNYKHLSFNASKLLLDYITNLQQAVKDTKDTADDMLFELKQENERLNNELIKLSQMISELNMFLNERLEEFKNAGKSRKNINVHHYYMLINAIKYLLVED